MIGQLIYWGLLELVNYISKFPGIFINNHEHFCSTKFVTIMLHFYNEYCASDRVSGTALLVS